jgi:tetratricopeptide (TPR) repeat protein
MIAKELAMTPSVPPAGRPPTPPDPSPPLSSVDSVIAVAEAAAVAAEILTCLAALRPLAPAPWRDRVNLPIDVLASLMDRSAAVTATSVTRLVAQGAIQGAVQSAVRDTTTSTASAADVVGGAVCLAVPDRASAPGHPHGAPHASSTVPEPPAPGSVTRYQRRLLTATTQAVTHAVTVITTATTPPGARGRRARATVVERAADWLDSCRWLILVAITAGLTVGEPALTRELIRAAWDAVEASTPVRADRPWREALAELGESVALTTQDPQLLAEVLGRSATWADRQDHDWIRAEQQWLRALTIHRRAGEHSTDVAVVFTALRDLYHRHGRHHQALDAAHEVLTEHAHRHDTRGVAHAHTALAVILLAAARPEDAAEQAEAAVAAFRDLRDTPPASRNAEATNSTGADRGGLDADLVDEAQALIVWGRCRWAAGGWRAARDRFSDALALLVDIDDTAADTVRDLLRVADGEPLPHPETDSAGDPRAAQPPGR